MSNDWRPDCYVFKEYKIKDRGGHGYVLGNYVPINKTSDYIGSVDLLTDCELYIRNNILHIIYDLLV